MGLMSTLAFLEASSANNAAQNAEREAREHREFVENQSNIAYFEETRNQTKRLFQDIYNNNGDISKVDLTNLERIKKPLDSRVNNSMNFHDPLALYYYNFGIKYFTIMTISTTAGIFSFFTLAKGFNIFTFGILLVSVFFIAACLSSFKDSIYQKKRNKEKEIKKTERTNSLIKLSQQFPELLAAGIVRKSYLDSVIYDVVNALLINGDRERVIKTYKAFFSLLTNFNDGTEYFDNRFKKEQSFNRASFSEYNNLIENR